MICNEGWCALFYYVRLMSPWVRSCKRGYYVSSWLTIRFSGRNLLHGVVVKNVLCWHFHLFTVWMTHTVFQELIFILFIYLLATYCTSQHYVLSHYPPTTARPPPFVLRSNKQTNKQYNLIHQTSCHRHPGKQRDRWSTVSSASSNWEQNVPTE
jgi:hypothetical protein